MSEKDLLLQVLAQQVVIYKKLCVLEDKLIKHKTSLAPIDSYKKELAKEASSVIVEGPKN